MAIGKEGRTVIMLNRPVPDWPTTVDQAVDRILDKLTKSQKDEICRRPAEFSRFGWDG
jgi:hypothetical protein